ncbi:MAG TPA: alpha/beta hydrolase [Arthrobacter sp.]|nr:alpha/beta hydrolase [Arthrobacter sp.]
MSRVSVNGVELYYEERGAGLPVLGIHGTPSSAVLWEEPAAELAGICRCITYDRRGFHRSERPEPFAAVDLSEHVDDASALLDALSATPAVVIGRSTGGEIALALAHRHPEQVTALVLLEPAVFWLDPDAQAWADRLREQVLEAAATDPRAAAAVVIREAVGDQVWESLPGELRDMFEDTSPAVLAEIRGDGLDLSENPPALGPEELATVRQPALLVSAEDSPGVLRSVNARLAELLPAAESVMVPGGHLINPAHPAVLEFLARFTGA